MSLTSSIKLIVDALQSSPIDLGARTARPGISASLPYSDGSGAAQANLVFSDTRTLAASGTESLDLSGSLTDAFGVTLTFARIKVIIIKAAAGNTNDVQLTRPASNGAPLFMAAGDGIAIKPGGLFVWADPGATGVPITNSTADLITLTNGAGITGVTYDIIIIGASA